MGILRKLCIFFCSDGTRIIGAFTMSISILLMNVLITSYFIRKKDDDFFDSIDTWALLEGFNWLQSVRYMEIKERAQIAMIYILIYIVSFLVASIYLVMGSMTKRYKCAIPWLCLQMINIIDQATELSDNMIHKWRDIEPIRPLWYLIISGFYLFFSIDLWMAVYAVQKQWYNEQQNCVSRISNYPPTSTNDSGLKSPSFLSQNFSIESPRPPTILPK